MLVLVWERLAVMPFPSSLGLGSRSDGRGEVIGDLECPWKRLLVTSSREDRGEVAGDPVCSLGGRVMTPFLSSLGLGSRSEDGREVAGDPVCSLWRLLVTPLLSSLGALSRSEEPGKGAGDSLIPACVLCSAKRQIKF